MEFPVATDVWVGTDGDDGWDAGADFRVQLGKGGRDTLQSYGTQDNFIVNGGDDGDWIYVWSDYRAGYHRGTIKGGNGDDYIDISSDNPYLTVLGGDGDDSIHIQGNTQFRGIFYGGTGSDYVSADVIGANHRYEGRYFLGPDDDIFWGGAALVNGGSGDDGMFTLDDQVIERVFAGEGNDTIAGAVRLAFGGYGDDVFELAGSDLKLFGGAGDDRLQVTGSGTAYGGDGSDLFDMTSGSICDFSDIQNDRIVVASDASLFRGAAAFSGREGEVRIQQYHHSVSIEFDFDGDAQSDSIVKVLGTTTLDAGDFLFGA